MGELFEVEGVMDGYGEEEATIHIGGDLNKVSRIGARMSLGRIVVEGDIGMHLGTEMAGGSLTVTGNAGSWLGCMMKGGRIEVLGKAGDYVGGAYRGGSDGMRSGKIIVHGDAGNEVGHFMKKGFIEVFGNVGQFAGIHMRDGTILIKGNSEGRLGAEMVGGKIVVCGHTPAVLPTFTFEDVREKVRAEEEQVSGPFYMFIGDLTEDGNGRLYVSRPKNPHLKVYERLLE